MTSSGFRVTGDQLHQAYQLLEEFVKIPSVSHTTSSYYSPKHLEQAALFAGSKLGDLGFNVRYPSIEGSAPYVIAERMYKGDVPTILFYGHYDVQPVETEKWKTDPFTLVEVAGRLYGRGASDDKAGIVAIITALKAYHEAGVELPVNIKILFEGEEEVASTHIVGLLEKEKEALKADALIVMDGTNISTEVGTLLSSTRGVVVLSACIQVLEKPIHSGIGCILPDPIVALATLITSLKNPASIPGFLDGCIPLTPEEITLLDESSQSVESYAQENGMRHGQLRGDASHSVYRRIREQPSITIQNMNSGDKHGGNVVQDQAGCTIGIRITNGQNPEHVATAVINHLTSEAAKEGLSIDVKTKTTSFPWTATLSGPFSKKYLEALEESFDKVGVQPCGGALPLLRQFEQFFPKMEAIVAGVEDPDCAAHSHNESQNKKLFESAVNGVIAFLGKV